MQSPILSSWPSPELFILAFCPKNRFLVPLHRFPPWRVLCLEQMRIPQISIPDPLPWPMYMFSLLRTLLALTHRTGELSCLLKGLVFQLYWFSVTGPVASSSTGWGCWGYSGNNNLSHPRLSHLTKVKSIFSFFNKIYIKSLTWRYRS